MCRVQTTCKAVADSRKWEVFSLAFLGGKWANNSLTWKMNNLRNIIRTSELDRPITLPVVLCGYETWSGTNTEEHWLRVIESGAKMVEVTGKWRTSHNEELNYLCISTELYIYSPLGLRGLLWGELYLYLCRCNVMLRLTIRPPATWLCLHANVEYVTWS